MQTATLAVSEDSRAPRPGRARRARQPRRLAIARCSSTAGLETLFLEHLDFIDTTVDFLTRRHALSPWDSDDFNGWVKLRLIADDYAIVRKFEGKSRLTTYLAAVLHNLFRDFRIHRWGKWRPSAAAKRLGELAIQLETLLYRDDFSFREAVAILRERFNISATDEQLEDIASRLRPRNSRRFESEATLECLASAERGDRKMIEQDHLATMARTERALAKILTGLESEDRLILKLRFAEGLPIASIAAALQLNRRRIYPRIRLLLAEVRRRLEREGVRCEDVLEILDWSGCDLDAGLSEVPGGTQP